MNHDWYSLNKIYMRTKKHYAYVLMFDLQQRCTKSRWHQWSGRRQATLCPVLETQQLENFALTSSLTTRITPLRVSDHGVRFSRLLDLRMDSISIYGPQRGRSWVTSVILLWHVEVMKVVLVGMSFRIRGGTGRKGWSGVSKVLLTRSETLGSLKTSWSLWAKK